MFSSGIQSSTLQYIFKLKIFDTIEIWGGGVVRARYSETLSMAHDIANRKSTQKKTLKPK